MRDVVTVSVCKLGNRGDDLCRCIVREKWASALVVERRHAEGTDPESPRLSGGGNGPDGWPLLAVPMGGATPTSFTA